MVIAGCLRVATTSMGTMEHVAPPFNLSVPSPEQNSLRAAELVRAAGESGAELCVLPETFRLCGLDYSDMPAHAEQLGVGPSSALLRPLSIQYKIIIVFGLMVQTDCADGGSWQVLNGAAVMDTEGEIAGCYFKRHPTPSEIENGVTPGSLDTNDNPVIVRVKRSTGAELRLGLAICFDVNWPELWQSIAGQDPSAPVSTPADVVLWISAYPGGMPLRMRAIEMQRPIVSCVQGTQASKVIDSSGRVKAATSRWQQLLVHNVCLQTRLFHTDGQADKIISIQTKYGHEVTVETLDEEHLFIISCEGLVDMNTIIGEFELIPYSEYIKQCTCAQRQKRLEIDENKGNTPIPNQGIKRCRE